MKTTTIPLLCAVLLATPAHCGEIHDAAKANDVEKVKALLASGADVNARDKDGETPLHGAAFNNHKEVAQLLLADGADANAKNNLGGTPLYWAAMGDCKDVAVLLLAKGADTNTKDNDGVAPLHWAAVRNFKDFAALLLAKGADVNAKDKDGKTPLHWVVQYRAREMAAILSDRYGKHENDRIQVSEEIQRGAKDMVELLLANGADVNAKDNGGQTALQLATKNDFKILAALLRAHGGKE